MKIFEVVTGHNGYLEPFVGQLMPDCHLWFSLLGGWEQALFENPLWRGINANFDSVAVELPCPINRRPTMTNQVMHTLCDNWFLEHTGVRFRSNAFFCDPAKNVAGSYGRPYIFVPKGEFKYCWSPAYHDLTLSIERMGGEIFQNFKRSVKGTQTVTPQLLEAVDEFLRDGEYQTDNIQGAYDEGTEIMVHCEEAYLIDPFKLKALR